MIVNYKQSALSLAVAGFVIINVSACTPRPVVQLPPPELATCAPEPKAPDIPARDGTEAVQHQRDVMTLEYILSLVSAGGDCRAKVQGLAKWRERM